jgi:hypothetical protein
MRKLSPYVVIAIALPALAVWAVWFWHYAREERRWKDIGAQVPSTQLSLSNTSALPNNGWLFGFCTNEYEVGHVVLRDGEVWRFAFASHHLFNGPDSYTVFESHRDTIRFKGAYFCCEVEFGDLKQPADTPEFVSLLRSFGDDVEILRAR